MTLSKFGRIDGSFIQHVVMSVDIAGSHFSRIFGRSPSVAMSIASLKGDLWRSYAS